MDFEGRRSASIGAQRHSPSDVVLGVSIVHGGKDGRKGIGPRPRGWKRPDRAQDGRRGGPRGRSSDKGGWERRERSGRVLGPSGEGGAGDEGAPAEGTGGGVVPAGQAPVVRLPGQEGGPLEGGLVVDGAGEVGWAVLVGA
jgi:hypothetical protein